MFEPRRYFENADRRKRIFDNLEILCAPEFEALFTKLFGGLGDRVDKPRVYSIRVPERTKEDIAQTKKMRDDFHWKVDDDEGLDVGEAYEDEEPANVPPSIFDILKSGKEFKDIVPSTKPKHTEIYKQAFGLDDDGNEIDLPDEEDEEDEEVPEVKNPFVFIANRLTFLAQTVQPIIFDTSLIETGSDYIKIALNEDKTFPKIRNFDELGLITCKLNCCQTIRDEIGEFIKGTEYTDIFCFPEFMSKDGPGTDVWAIKFICYKRK